MTSENTVAKYRFRLRFVFFSPISASNPKIRRTSFDVFTFFDVSRTSWV